jgi:hypothetical protein
MSQKQFRSEALILTQLSLILMATAEPLKFLQVQLLLQNTHIIILKLHACLYVLSLTLRASRLREGKQRTGVQGGNCFEVLACLSHSEFTKRCHTGPVV